MKGAMVSGKCIEGLPVRLTEEEVTAMGRRNAKASDELGMLELELKARNDECKSKQGEIEREIAYRNSCINTGQEMREVECEEILDRYTGKARLVRRDTNEVVRVRPMQAHEYQTELDLSPEE